MQYPMITIPVNNPMLNKESNMRHTLIKFAINYAIL